MPAFRLFAALSLMALASCGGSAKPAVVADPARGLRNLGPDSAVVAAVALEAARSLPPARGGAQPMFAGVYVEGKKATRASDDVARAMGFTQVQRVLRTPVECRVVSSNGQSRTVPCPPAAMANVPPTYTFDEVRATPDSAYVGVDETTNSVPKASCITLLRVGSSWRVVNTTIIANARNCGK